MDEAPASRIWERSSNEFLGMGVGHTELRVKCLKKCFFGGGREYNVCVNILSVCMSGPDTLKGQKRVRSPGTRCCDRCC